MRLTRFICIILCLFLAGCSFYDSLYTMPRLIRMDAPETTGKSAGFAIDTIAGEDVIAHLGDFDDKVEGGVATGEDNILRRGFAELNLQAGLLSALDVNCRRMTTAPLRCGLKVGTPGNKDQGWKASLSYEYGEHSGRMSFLGKDGGGKKKVFRDLQQHTRALSMGYRFSPKVIVYSTWVRTDYDLEGDIRRLGTIVVSDRATGHSKGLLLGLRYHSDQHQYFSVEAGRTRNRIDHRLEKENPVWGVSTGYRF